MAQPTSTIGEREARLVKQVDSIPPWRRIAAHLENSAGAKNMAVDGSGGSPQSFSFSLPPNYDGVLVRLMVFMQCSSAMSVDVFGNLGAALGIGIEIKANGVLLTTWKDNIDIYTEMFDIDTLSNVSDAPVDTTLHGRWTFTKDTNSLGIFIPNGALFEAIVNDDLTTITKFHLKLKGKLIPAAKR